MKQVFEVEHAAQTAALNAARPGVLALWSLGCGRSRPDFAPVPLASLRAASDAYLRAAATRDTALLARLFARDMLSLSPQAPRPVYGREPNIAAWQRLRSGRNPEHTMSTDSLFVTSLGDMGYSTGPWRVGVDAPNGRATSEGYYVAVWRKIDGAWKIVAVSAFTAR